jgi:hypothetical protein
MFSRHTVLSSNRAPFRSSGLQDRSLEKLRHVASDPHMKDSEIWRRTFYWGDLIWGTTHDMTISGKVDVHFENVNHRKRNRPMPTLVGGYKGRSAGGRELRV